MDLLLIRRKTIISKLKAYWHFRQDHRIWQWNQNYTQLAVCDLLEGFRKFPLWVRLGWQDIVLRYRRSIIGPFWLTLSTGVMVGTLGLLYGGIFKINIDQYLPYLTIGLVVWGIISGVITEGCQIFIEAEWLLRQLNLPLSMFALRAVWRNLILFLHNVPIYLLVAVFFHVSQSWILLLTIPALMILLANAFWCSLLLGMLSARFRDFPQIVASILQVAFFVTPIIWTPQQAEHGRFLLHGNPFFHLIEIMRAPMLGQLPPAASWKISIVIMAVGYIGTFFFYRRFHGRIAYWV